MRERNTMKELGKIQNYCFAAGALLMVVGVGCVVLGVLPHLMSVVFAIGAITFALLQMSQTYSGNSMTIKRLRKIMVIGDICFILAAILQLEHCYKFLAPHFYSNIDGMMFYTQYIYNNWVVPLLIGAVLEMYTTHRISSELKKENNRETTNS